MRSLKLGLLALLLSTAADAQSPPSPPPAAILGGCATLAVTSTSASVALGVSAVTYPVLYLLNDGATEVFVVNGGSTVVATTAAGAPIPAGKWIAPWVGNGPGGYVAAITSTSTSTLRICQYTGAPSGD